MSALALLLHEKGYGIQGSDTSEYIFTQEKLLEKNINIRDFGQLEHAITSDSEVIVGNSFTVENNIDYKLAENLGRKITKYTDFLAKLCNETTSIAVSGTHGKTSTTNILAQLDWSNYSNISFIIGDGTGGSLKSKSGLKTTSPQELFIFEACEYKKNFLQYDSKIAIITNIDFDHPDAFLDINETKSVFRSFLENTKEITVVNGDDKNILDVIVDLKIKVVKYGFSHSNDAVISSVHENSIEMYTKFELEYLDRKYQVLTPFFGKHNIMNVVAALVTNLSINGKSSLLNNNIIDLRYLQGAKRRFQETWVNNAIVIDDYGHHPTEIRVTIEACRNKYPQKKIIAIFQPHTLSRFETFLEDFKRELSKADDHFFTDIYSPANREKKTDEINIVSPAYSLEKIKKIKHYKDAVYLFLSAGNIEKYKKEILNILE